MAAAARAAGPARPPTPAPAASSHRFVGSPPRAALPPRPSGRTNLQGSIPLCSHMASYAAFSAIDSASYCAFSPEGRARHAAITCSRISVGEASG
eukprot:scaffold151860_cov27-Tisochrysis_lutea.AAC.5